MAFSTAILLAATAVVSHSRWVAPKIETGPNGWHTCVLTHVGEVKCWGANNVGQLGIEEDIFVLGGAADFDGNSLQPVDLGDDRYAVDLAVGEKHTCALLDNGKVKCWGMNQQDGRLGYGDADNRGMRQGEMGNNLPAIDLGSDSAVVNIWAGSMHTCVLLESHEVKCWGSNGAGQLGWPSDDVYHGKADGDMGEALESVDLGVGADGPFVSDMALGQLHTCARFTDGTVKCWGKNSNGQLGYGDDGDRGRQPGTMGTRLPSIDLGSGRTAVQISAGTRHTCALLDNEVVKCWGADSRGQTGRGGCGSNSCGDDRNEMGVHMEWVDFGTSAKPVEVKSGSDYSCAVLDDASVKCWGSNTYGNLGYGDQEPRGASSDQLGETNWPKVDLGAGARALSVSCAMNTCVALADGQVKCFGQNSDGVLGIGSDKFDQKTDQQKRFWGDEPGEMGADLPTVLTMVFASTVTATETETTTLTATATETTTVTGTDTATGTTKTATTHTVTTHTVTTHTVTLTTAEVAGFISSAPSPGGGLVAPLVIMALAAWARP